MEFWGVEVKSGEPLLVGSGDEFFVHLSQACLGEVKKDRGNESVCVSVKIDDKKIVLGTLSPEKFPHLPFDLVFHKDFELSHNWKHGSVFFSGYKVLQDDGSNDESDSELEPETKDLTVATKNDEELQLREGKFKSDPAGSKQKVKIVEPSKDDKPDEETDDSDDSTADDDESSDEDDSSDDKNVANKAEDDESDDDSDESDDDSDESDEDEETPTVLKTEQGKKRSAESAKKTPLPDKKAKLVTPQKTDSKKPTVHVATPHPSKKIIKTPVNNDQKKEQQSQKSFRCTSCNRSFGSEVALQSHSKAKHSAA